MRKKRGVMLHLIDVNVILALLADGHLHRKVATEWLETVKDDSVVVTRPVQLSVLRLLSNATVMNGRPLTAKKGLAVWGGMMLDPRFVFLHEDPAKLDMTMRPLVSDQLASGGQWIDIYLAALAINLNLELVTLDQGFRHFPGLSCHFL
jgi:uncharacterized protein